MTEHDQNFKNLILDYPRQALAFFAESEAKWIDDRVRIIPVRQEQLKERLGERFRELDIPLLVEWPDGRRAAILFVLEEETDPRRFNLHRLAHYCLDLAELFATDRVVPVVIFLRRGPFSRELHLGGDRDTYLSFHYLACVLGDLPLERYLTSDNLVARLNLPNMRYHSKEDKLRAYAYAIRGLLELEPDPEKQFKYLDFIDIYAGLDEDERAAYQRQYPQEVAIMETFASRFEERGIKKGFEQGIQQGLQQGLQQGRRLGEAEVLLRLLECKFGLLTEEQRRRIEEADADTLLVLAERVLTAETIHQVFGNEQ
jgi:hypothetical protein